jgi:alkanesulfonate monooxygenase SsuD/methylene tetrahydromethanopterin reductase-like flavin-dependent oxidoreductase (luciferase family)
VQAGSSDDGKALAAKHADVHFAVSRTIEDGRRYRADFDSRLVAVGREPQDLKILPGVHPVIGGSREEAKEKEDFLRTLVPERIGIDLVSSWSGVPVGSSMTVRVGFSPDLDGLPIEKSRNRGASTSVPRASRRPESPGPSA